MTYTATISDGGAKIERTIAANTLEDACGILERELRDAEEVFAGNPDCDPRTAWSCIIYDDVAECSLSGVGQQNSSEWVKCSITEYTGL